MQNSLHSCLCGVCLQYVCDTSRQSHSVSLNWIALQQMYSDECESVIVHFFFAVLLLESSWDVMAHGDAREGKWRGNWRMEWVASTLYTTSEHGVASITTADAHTSAATSRLNWCPLRFNWTRPFRERTKSGVCACAITFETQSTCSLWSLGIPLALYTHTPPILNSSSYYSSVCWHN